jgi:hypothetical protein
MRFRNLVLTAAVAAALAGCTNETLDSVNLSSVKNKTEYQLSSKMVSKMRELGMQKTSPILLRIFKEEGTLEVWKANTANRFPASEELQDLRLVGQARAQGEGGRPAGAGGILSALSAPDEPEFVATTWPSIRAIRTPTTKANGRTARI